MRATLFDGATCRLVGKYQPMSDCFKSPDRSLQPMTSPTRLQFHTPPTPLAARSSNCSERLASRLTPGCWIRCGLITLPVPYAIGCALLSLFETTGCSRLTPRCGIRRGLITRLPATGVASARHELSIFRFRREFIMWLPGQRCCTYERTS